MEFKDLQKLRKYNEATYKAWQYLKSEEEYWNQQEIFYRKVRAIITGCFLIGIIVIYWLVS